MEYKHYTRRNKLHHTVFAPKDTYQVGDIVQFTETDLFGDVETGRKIDAEIIDTLKPTTFNGIILQLKYIKDAI